MSEPSIESIMKTYNLNNQKAFIFWLIKKYLKDPVRAKKKLIAYKFNESESYFYYNDCDSLLIWQFIRALPRYRIIYKKYSESKSDDLKNTFRLAIQSKYFLKVPIDPDNMRPSDLEIRYQPLFSLAMGLPVQHIQSDMASRTFTLASFINSELATKAAQSLIYTNRTTNKIDKRNITQILPPDSLLKCLYVYYFQVKKFNSKNKVDINLHLNELFKWQIKQESQLIRIQKKIEKIFLHAPNIFFS